MCKGVLTYLQLPEEYTFVTLLVAGDNVTDAMMQYGNILRTIHAKDDSYRKTDFTINYLGLVHWCQERFGLTSWLYLSIIMHVDE